MCTNYQTNEFDRFEAFSPFFRPDFEYRRDIFKDYYVASIFRRSDDECATDPATFALIGAVASGSSWLIPVSAGNGEAR